ncbi:MAG TPA: winged helix-turn-helix domain-containing protein [Steroidobacteraceae bacterium]|nr:winged helix-turn-helix domain-containing protein [Steroidobacteraceae bacterium]
MDQPTAVPLRIGTWRFDPASGQISRAGEVARLEARSLRLLLYLAERAGETLSIEELLDQVWAGVVVTPDSVYQAIASLRRLLGDDARQPAYIVTVPRLGYRMVAPVSPWLDEPAALIQQAAAGPGVAASASAVNTGKRHRMPVLLTAAGLVLCLALAAALFYGSKVNGPHILAGTAPAKSVAVLPFLDLTSEQMEEEYFADGMTEELIDKLSALPGMRVPSPAASFYFKGKKVPVAEIARSLGVLYVLSGSVRESASMLRIAVRLTRADDGYVIWSSTYDRPAADKVKVQEDIAREVAKALGGWIKQAA